MVWLGGSARTVSCMLDDVGATLWGLDSGYTHMERKGGGRSVGLGPAARDVGAFGTWFSPDGAPVC